KAVPFFSGAGVKVRERNEPSPPSSIPDSGSRAGSDETAVTSRSGDSRSDTWKSCGAEGVSSRVTWSRRLKSQGASLTGVTVTEKKVVVVVAPSVTWREIVAVPNRL